MMREIHYNRDSRVYPRPLDGNIATWVQLHPLSTCPRHLTMIYPTTAIQQHLNF